MKNKNNKVIFYVYLAYLSAQKKIQIHISIFLSRQNHAIRSQTNLYRRSV